METDQQRADLLVQGTLLGEALERAQVAAFVIDADRHYVAVNEYACVLTGYSREEILAVKVGDLNVESELPHQYAEVANGTRDEGEVLIRHRDGSELRIRCRAVPTTLAGVPYLLVLVWPAGP